MKDRVFIDTNIILYAYSEDEISKQKISNELIFGLDNPCLSNQVISELSNVFFRKFNLNSDLIKETILELADVFNIFPITLSAQITALKIKEKYNLQYYDSLIIATAIENKCTILFSEDMQNNQIIEDQLVIINPFSLK